MKPGKDAAFKAAQAVRSIKKHQLECDTFLGCLNVERELEKVTPQ